jgi:hypothetical protein
MTENEEKKELLRSFSKHLGTYCVLMRYRTSIILEQNVKASVSETHISTNITLEGQSHVDCFPDIKGNIHYEFVPLNSQPNFPTFKVLKVSAAK